MTDAVPLATPAPPSAPTGWRRWLPNSLFGRLMGVLALGLMLAQLLSAAINVAERDRLLTRGYGVQAAQRIADVVDLLDSLPEAERARVLALFRLPPLVLSLQDAPALPQTPPAALAAGRGALFAQRLQAALGDGRVFRVAAVPGWDRRDGAGAAEADAGRHPRGHPNAMRMPQAAGMPVPDTMPQDAQHAPDAAAWRMQRRAWARAQAANQPVWRTEVQLLDGRWAVFDAAMPQAQERLPWRLALTLLVLLASMLALAWVAVRWVVRPLHVLAQAAQGLGEDIGRPPLPEDGPREVRQAAQAFNTMQQRLAQFIQERTRLLTALSHDLKTPLTRMRLRTELLDDAEARRRFEADLLEMETMVTQTLDFMRGLGGHEPRAPMDINALLAGLVADQQAMGRAVQQRGTAQTAFVGVASLLRRALGNLVDNAVLYGGSATVQVDDSAGTLVLQVLDQGPGIPEAQLAQVFVPFHRLEGSRNRATGGTGLGLGIARSIAQLHGGTLTLHNRPEGGLAARLSLPRRPA
jgi:signal transduction histidine kinase